MKSLLTLVLCLLALTSLSCSDSSADWQGAEAKAKSYFETLASAKVAEAYAMHDADSQLRKATSEDAFTQLYTDARAKYPSLLNFSTKLEAQKHTSTRAGLFEFKATLSWKNGYPLKGVELDGPPLLAEEMRITIKKSGESFALHVVRPWYDLSQEMQKTKP
ncbi:MAG: hypothetical protein KDB07_04525 [Planctomycetes bacterium]|nr:hypothetical protein [Planctomycetota bacterium]